MHELEPWKFSNLCFKFGPSFASAQLARALRGFLSRPTCLPPVLAGGSTVKSSSPNKSWSRIPVNSGRATPQPSPADSESLSSRGWGDSQSQPEPSRECFPTNVRFQGLSLAEPTWASGKFKLMSGPVTSWPGPEPRARLDPRRTSDTSQKVPCDVRVGFSDYIPCINHGKHRVMHAGSVVV